MAFPFKTGGDFYNCEAQRMRLHNLGANPTETATGLMYFNTGASNLGKHAVVHDGTNFKALAFVDEIATNAEFVELKEKVDLLIGDDVDTDTIIDSWKEVQAFLADIEDTKTLQGMLSSYLPKSGGTIEGGMGVLNIKRNVANFSSISFENTSGLMGYLGFYRADQPAVRMSDNTTTHLLLHEGNIGEYKAGDADKLDGIDSTGFARVVSYPQTSDSNWNIQSGIYSTLGGTEGLPLGSNGHQVIQCNWDGNAANQLFLAYDRDLFAFRRKQSNVWKDWKTIAFTDSDITGNAAGLKHSNGTVGATVKSNGDVDFAKNILLIGSIVKYNDNNVAYFGSAQDGLGESYDGALMYSYGQRNLYFYTGKGIRMLINSSGNVTIGDGDLAGTNYRLYVNTGKSLFYAWNNTAMSLGSAQPYSLLVGSDVGLGMWYQSGVGSVLQSERFDGTAEAYNLVLNPLGGNVLIGTTNKIKSGAKLQIKGDVYVDGNIIATKEVSAGGAGQEGESGDGGAEVIDKELAKGQSSYTIPNTIGRSAVAVSLYEWNANNSSWDMCLADISVKDATITVTFGSATSVNHKLVAVG